MPVPRRPFKEQSNTALTYMYTHLFSTSAELAEHFCKEKVDKYKFWVPCQIDSTILTLRRHKLVEKSSVQFRNNINRYKLTQEGRRYVEAYILPKFTTQQCTHQQRA